MDALTSLNNVLKKASEYSNAGLAKAQEYSRPAMRKAVKKTNEYTPQLVQSQVNRGVKWVQTKVEAYEYLKKAEEKWWTRKELYDIPPGDDECGSDDETREHELEEARLEELERQQERERGPPQMERFIVPVPLLVSPPPSRSPSPTPGAWEELGNRKVKRDKKRAPTGTPAREELGEREIQKGKKRSPAPEPQVIDASGEFQIKYTAEQQQQRDQIAARLKAGTKSSVNKEEEEWDDDIRPFDPQNTALELTPYVLRHISQDPDFVGTSLRPGEVIRARTDREILNLFKHRPR